MSLENAFCVILFAAQNRCLNAGEGPPPVVQKIRSLAHAFKSPVSLSHSLFLPLSPVNLEHLCPPLTLVGGYICPPTLTSQALDPVSLVAVVKYLNSWPTWLRLNIEMICSRNKLLFSIQIPLCLQKAALQPWLTHNLLKVFVYFIAHAHPSLPSFKFF